jgi:hypothetical protein
MSTESHVPPLPAPVVTIRGVQLAAAVVALGLSAYGLSWLIFDAVELMLFTVSIFFFPLRHSLTPKQAIATIVITIYNIVSFVALQQAYNYVSRRRCGPKSLIFEFQPIHKQI